MLTMTTMTGCRLFVDDEPVAKSLLQPAQASPDSVTMEIIWARFPESDPQLNADVWTEIDETRIAPAVRRELANNGFRVGVIGGSLPDAIARALNHGDDPAGAAGAANIASTVGLSADPIVHGRVQQLHRNQRSEILASDVHESMPLLLNRANTPLSGRNYQQAQAIYALRVDAQPDRSVLVELTPELHHGATKNRWTRGDDGNGIPRLAPLRDREVFNSMRMSAKLSPGEMLLLMGLPESGSRLGQYFHTVDSTEGRQQKLILIRLAEFPPSDTFDDIR
jgi:hypothetical protein